MPEPYKMRGAIGNLEDIPEVPKMDLTELGLSAESQALLAREIGRASGRERV